MSKNRFEQFSDGVFAIAITLLALELHVPHLTHTTLAGAAQELIPLIPNILTFFLSFFTVAIFWINHHQLTQEMGPIKRRTLWMNILLLFFVTLIPFVIEATRINPLHPLTVLTFSLVLFGASTSFSALRYLVHKSLNEKHVFIRRSIVGPLFYILAALTCFVSVWISYVLLLIPPIFYFLPKSREVDCDDDDRTQSAHMLHFAHSPRGIFMTFIRRILLLFVIAYFFAASYHLLWGDSRMVTLLQSFNLGAFQMAFGMIALIIVIGIIWRPLRMIGTLTGSAFVGGALVMALASGRCIALVGGVLLSLWIVLKLSWWKHWCLCGKCSSCRARLEKETLVTEKCDCAKPGCMCERGKCDC